MKMIVCDRCKRSNEVSVNLGIVTNEKIQEVSLIFDEEGDSVEMDLCGWCVNEVKRIMLEKI